MYKTLDDSFLSILSDTKLSSTKLSSTKDSNCYLEKQYCYIDLNKVLDSKTLQTLPYSIRSLLENVARCSPAALSDVLDCIHATSSTAQSCEVPFYPNRLMLHDTTCLPALADFAGMRDLVAEMGGDPKQINPVIPSVLTIDHSVIVEHYAEANAAEKNLDIDFKRNKERYEFIKWAQQSLDNFAVVPPGTGIIHQINMESLATIIVESQLNDETTLMHLDHMVATDSHTPMINALSVLGWGVGGLEGQAAMLGEAVTIRFPQTLGVRLVNRLRSGVTAVDLALTVTKLLREKDVVGKFVEFCGPGLSELSWGARGTLANMAPEYGATVVFFPFDDVTMKYMELTGRSIDLRNKIRTYLNAQGLWRYDHFVEPTFTDLIELDLASIELSVAGPHQPHQWFKLADTAKSYKENAKQANEKEHKECKEYYEPSFGEALTDGAIAIASITSCTNTANPRQMIQAALLARNARNNQLHSKPWLKTSLSPGSRVVADYLAEANLLDDFSALGFDIVGFGCMTCIGNSGGLEPHVETFADQGLETVVVLSGNRNFQSRVNPKIQAGYLMSPALVVAYSLVGTIDTDIQKNPLGKNAQGKDIYLSDIMPSDEEVEALLAQVIKPELFKHRNQSLWDGSYHWRALEAQGSTQFDWQPQSTYFKRPIYLQTITPEPAESLDINNARVLLVLGDNITTDHISPASAIPLHSQAGQWLIEHGESAHDLNQYSTRRSNHEVMMRGSFVNPSLENQLLDSQPAEGGWARTVNGEVKRVYDAALSYVEQDIPLLIFAGWNYGAGSSRDWAAKSQATLGIKAVIAQSFERIHRSNLIGMGVFPIEFLTGESIEQLKLDGTEHFNMSGLDTLTIGDNTVYLEVIRSPAFIRINRLNLTIDSQQELQYLKHNGVLPSIVRSTIS